MFLLADTRDTGFSSDAEAMLNTSNDIVSEVMVWMKVEAPLPVLQP